MDPQSTHHVTTAHRKSKFEDLRDTIERIAEDNHLKDYHAFVYWFIETMYEWDESRIINCICDGTHDKGIDAIVIDDIEEHVVIIQSKYEHEGGVSTIKDKDIRDFGTVKDYFRSQKAFGAATAKANASARQWLDRAFHAAKNKNYDLQLVFISTHRGSDVLEDLIVETLGFKPYEFTLYDYSRIMQLQRDRERDFTPPLGNYFLPFESLDGEMVRTTSNNAWVMSVSTDRIRGMVNDLTPEKLFRKNVRNFLGRNIFNNRIAETLSREPSNFWYYNNGITILCDEGNLDKEHKGIRMKNPQIVNGCQTAMSIKKFPGDLSGDVLVRVIQGTDYEFINAITLYQNSSNPVKNRDFKSNDPVQVRLKHEFRRRGWFYYIKRGESFKDETRKSKSAKVTYERGELNNEAVAKCLVAVDDPGLALSKGSETFFGDKYNDIFTTDISSFHCLAPLLLSWLIKDTYNGKTNFHGFRSSTFKGRATYHIIALLYQMLHLRGTETWEKQFVYFWESASDKDWNSFFRRMKKMISEVFEIYYEGWHAENRKSKIEYDTFLERETTIKDITSRFRARMTKLFKMTNGIFDELVLAKQPMTPG